MQKWQHNFIAVEEPIGTDALAGLGEEGWELVAYAERSWSYENPRDGHVSGTTYTYAFKRPKPKPQGNAPTIGGA